MTVEDAQSANTYRLWHFDADGDVRLIASKDVNNDNYFFPPLPLSSPVGRTCELISLRAPAVLHSYTTIHPNPKTGKVPFTLVYADFREGVRVFGKLKSKNGGAPCIGCELDVELEAQPDGTKQYVFAVRAK